MKKITAVILAAGRGTRLRGALIDKPKAFLPVLEKTFISRAVDILHHAGISDVVIVTGHDALHFQHFAATHAGVRTAHNPDFVEKGTMQSLLMGLNVTFGSVIVLDADIVYEARAVEELIRSNHPNAVALASTGLQGDEVLAWTGPASTQGTPLLHLSKNPHSRSTPASLEHIGIIKLGADLADALRRDGEDMIAAQPLAPYEECLNGFLNGHHVEAHHLADLIWTEVDDEKMWRRAEAQVFKALAQADEGASSGSTVTA